MFFSKNLQSALYLCKDGLQRFDCNKPKRYHHINNHTNNNHHEDVNTTLQGGPKRPDRRQVESHVRSSRGWRTPARDWSRRPRSGSYVLVIINNNDNNYINNKKNNNNNNNIHNNNNNNNKRCWHLFFLVLAITESYLL